MTVSSGSLLSSASTGGRLELTAGGAWTAANAGELERLIDGVAAQRGAGSIDMRAVQALDTFGAWLLERLVRQRRARGEAIEVVGLPERFSGLIGEVHQTNLQIPPKPAAANPVLRGLDSLGRSVSSIAHDMLPLLHMLGALAMALLQAIVQPRRFRFTSAVNQLDRIAWQAVPIILLITFLIGGIIAQQGIFHFRKFGAETYVVDMVGILVLREIGVLIVAIMVAGRSGSSITAELGSMKMREEIDALRTMGHDPVGILILPRVLALVIAMPILAFLGAMAALYGGGLIAWAYGGMSPDIFVSRLKDAISITHFQVGMIKAPVMALAIGIVACAEGLRVQGSAESLGIQTTRSVVKSIFLVIVLDGIFAIFFASIGM
jgi:phospholipid/cholesterol/gamma-HCH transport system permease protein